MERKRIIAIVVLITIAIIIGVVAILKPEKKEMPLLQAGKIRISKSYWSGERNFKEPEPEVSEYDIELNKRINLGGIGDLEIIIVKVNKDSITIKTSIPMSGNEGGINLRTKKTEFIIEKGKTLHLVTPTMDAGSIFDIDINM